VLGFKNKIALNIRGDKKVSQLILLIDEDTELTDVLSHHLEAEGFKVSSVPDGESGLKKAINNHFHAIILDMMLPKINGLDVIKSIREHSDVPILMLTARGDDIDRVVGLKLGADDYLRKPCNPLELILRLRAILKRTDMTPEHKPIIEFHDFKIDCAKRTIVFQKKELDLTTTEFNILEILIKSPGQAFSKEELTEYAIGRKFTTYDRSIDVHISNLRNKLSEHPSGETIIKTVRGFGYLINP
jgi:two-component system response regulator CpxR